MATKNNPNKLPTGIIEVHNSLVWRISAQDNDSSKTFKSTMSKDSVRPIPTSTYMDRITDLDGFLYYQCEVEREL